MYLYLILLSRLSLIFSTINDLDCEKNAPINYNSAQKKLLCNNSSSIGPSLCAKHTKENFHLSINDTISLCEGAVSIDPSKCLSLILDKKLQLSHGIRLCRHTKPDDVETANGYRSECFQKLLSSPMKSQFNLNPNEAFDYCSSLLDTKSPLDCSYYVINKRILSDKEKTLRMCSKSLSSTNATIQCFHDMLNKLNSLSLSSSSSEELVRFCSSAYPEAYEPLKQFNYSIISSPLAYCFYLSNSITTLNLNTKQRMQLCNNAPPIGDGPINCFKYLLSKTSNEISISESIRLCQHSLAEGPSKCFIESKGYGNSNDRIDLCIGANNAGPAQCAKLVQSTFKKDSSMISMLCSGSSSETPAQCAMAAPLHLSMKEKIHLCSNVPQSKGNDPVTCLKYSESYIKSYQTNNKKYSLDLLINMCSYTASMYPLASADCLKSAPKSLVQNLREKIIPFLTRRSNTIMYKYFFFRGIISCLSMYEVAAKVYGHFRNIYLMPKADSRLHAEKLVNCYIDLHSYLKSIFTNYYSISSKNILNVCTHENSYGTVRECVKEVILPTTILSSDPNLSLQLITSVCTLQTNHSMNAVCLSTLLPLISSQLLYSNLIDLSNEICSSNHPINTIICLKHLSSAMITLNQINRCKQDIRVPISIKVVSILSDDETTTITAGHAFTIQLLLFDQYNSKYVDKYTNLNKIMIGVSINDNNAQGAVLWGQRTSYSQIDGSVTLKNLMITLPGIVYLKFANLDKSIVLGIFKVEVHADRTSLDLSHCIFVFHSALCPSHITKLDYDKLYPRYTSFLSTDYLFNSIYCQSIYQSWYITSSILPNGLTWLEFKTGIDILWLGDNRLPKHTMSYEERLDIVQPYKEWLNLSIYTKNYEKSSNKFMKQIKTNYYRQSLLWHPDRWSSMSIYSIPVKGIFECIVEAYEELNKQIDLKLTEYNSIRRNNTVITWS